MTDRKLKEAYHERDHLWIGGEAVRELHKTTSIAKRDVKSGLRKQEFCKVYIHP